MREKGQGEKVLLSAIRFGRALPFHAWYDTSDDTTRPQKFANTVVCLTAALRKMILPWLQVRSS